jgi:hypothetical protein
MLNILIMKKFNEAERAAYTATWRSPRAARVIDFKI